MVVCSHREAAVASSGLLDILTADALHHVLSHLPLQPFCLVGGVCTALCHATRDPSRERLCLLSLARIHAHATSACACTCPRHNVTPRPVCRLVPAVLAQLTLDQSEPPHFTPERERLLQRLAEAGNGAACYRLGLAYAYHPRPTEERSLPLEDSAALLRRAMEVGDTAIAADAAYELWLLTRRLPASAKSSEELLAFAASAGHSPARFAAGSSSRCGSSSPAAEK